MVSFSSFSANKSGYRKYLNSKGYVWDGVNSPMYELTLSEFVSCVENCPDNKSKELQKEVDRLSDIMDNNLKSGIWTLNDVFSNDPLNNAFVLQSNIDRLVRKM